jgi:prepilin-type N-terminal cleavage/methylation domain-containing protein
MKAGISIVEVMVVIAIVAVLAALLLPSVARGKASARKAQCVSHLKQWGITWNVFTSDNNGFFSDGQDAGFPRGEWVWPWRINTPVNRTC